MGGLPLNDWGDWDLFDATGATGLTAGLGGSEEGLLGLAAVGGGGVDRDESPGLFFELVGEGCFG